MSHAFAPISHVARELWRGRTLTRSLFHCALPRYTIRGRVLDLGSKERGGEYFEFLQQEDVQEIVHTDLVPGAGLIAVDVEQTFPFDDASFDTVLAFHLFEHVYRFQRAPLEVARVLRKGGRVLVATPFMHPFHAAPDDFFRYTDMALRRMWEDAGLVCEEMRALGEGIFTSFATTFAEVLVPGDMRRSLNTALYLLSAPLDRVIAKYRPKIDGRSVPERYANEFLAVFRKPTSNG